ncbi:PKD domain-containing protein [Fulvivirgaceae bacterium BMA10]|uniref:PKD domain-containing protein n=1 Tax=Splendidivirga corallicola TaxID=3051826 RepID=A0ABT8KIG6_9BACT|nr:PKD domain-containing protein [Fulvivirgaceae bacterium BMA10]
MGKRFLPGKGVYVIVGLVFILNIQNSYAQGFYDYNWYFGNSREGIIFNKFNTDPLRINDQSVPFGDGGSAVATDHITGDLLFYSDGQDVYDASHNVMSNGNGVGTGAGGNQPVVISPVPGQQGMYYLFTNSASFNTPGEIRYSIIDMNAQGNAGAGQPPLGEVVGGSKNIATGILNTAEGMIVIAGGSPPVFWLIVQNQVSGEVTSYRIQAGASFTNTSSAIFPTPPPIVANFSYSNAAGKIAMAPQEANKNIVLLDFDIGTGILTLDTTVPNSAVNDGFPTEAIYDTEWSPDGTKLYISRHGNTTAPGATGDLYQFDLNNTSISLTSLIGGPIYRSYGLKRGPDNRIYHLYQTNLAGSIVMGRINFPDSAAASIGYETSPLAGPSFVSRQFPEFAYPDEIMLNPISFMYLDSCQNTATKFFPQFDDEPQPENFRWDFGDGQTSNAQSPNYTYQAPGNYNVTLEVTVDGEIETFSQMVQIFQNDLMADLGNDTTICPGETLVLDPSPQGGSGSFAYGWSTGENTSTITVDSAGTYWVVVTDLSTGCDAYDAIEVRVFGNEEQKANYWYFGQNAGIDFNEMPPVPLSDGAQNAPEGVATVSDVNGDLLFYTDGQTVYNRDHAVMLNGDNIGGDPTATQSTIIVEFPGDETMFYIFTTDEAYGDLTFNLNYSVVDLKEDAPRGAVTIKNKPLFAESTERITGTNGGGFTWLMAHEYGNNSFRAYPIDSTGIGTPVISSVGSVHNKSVETNAWGYMKFSTDNSKLAVALPGNPNLVEIFDFDVNTGEVSNPIQLDVMEPLPSYVYGLEFSPGGNKLYVTVNGNPSPSKLKEYYFDSLRTRIEFLGETVENASLGAIQFAPDGQIYVAVDGAGSLGTISANEDTTQVSAFNVAGFALAGGTTSRLGLPNFIQTIIPPTMDPTMSVTQACAGQETQFSASGVTPDIDEFFWTFGDGNTSNDQNPMHTYASPGTYNVAVQITNRCGYDTTLVQTVEAFAPPTTRAPETIPLCDGPVQITASDDTDPTLTFAWISTSGQTFDTNIITVDQPGTYTVTITNGNGCTTTGDFLVADGRPLVDLGPDQTVCQNANFPDLDASNPGASFVWRIDGADQSNNSRLQTVDTSAPGTFQYTVEVTDPLTACVGRDTVNITVMPEPDISYAVTTQPTCGMFNGVLEITFNGTGDFTYDLTGPMNFTNQMATGPTTANIPGLGAGTYTLTVTDNISGCVRVENNVIVENDPAAFSMTATPMDDTDCSGNGSVTLTLSAGGDYPVTWRLFDSNGVEINNGNQAAAMSATDFTVSGLGEGDYTIEVTNSGGCIQSESFTINQPTELPFVAQAPLDECDQATLEITEINGVPIASVNLADYQIQWSTTTGNFTTTILDGPVVGADQLGTHEYFVQVTDLTGTFCPSTDTLEVTITEQLDVSIQTSGDPCEGELQLTAQVNNMMPGEFFTYDWVSLPDLQTVTATQSGNYAVRVRSNLRICVAQADVNITVYEPLEVTLAVDQACDNGEPFTISATANQANVTYAWTLNNVALSFDTPDIEVSDEGQYIVTISNADCQASDTLDVTRAPFDQGSLPASAIICPADTDPMANSVELDPGSGFATYEWLLDGTVVSSNQILTATQAGTYEVRLTNAFNCTDVQSIEVIEDCIPKVAAPNAFSPNGNAQNDDFFVFSTFVTDFEIFIYNRWGELVYQSADKNFRWDGSFNGKPAPTGTYAYVIRFTSDVAPEKGTIEQHGGVTLLR